MLEIASEFFELNDIIVNKEKSVLLVNNQKENKKEFYNNVINLAFRNTEIIIKPLAPEESVRFLGVWINAKDDRKFVINQIKQEIENTINILKKKRLTDKQILYIFNKITSPIIEYRTQVTILSQKECSKLTSNYRKFVKNKLNCNNKIPDCIIHSENIYNLFNIYDIQKRSQTTNLLAQLNDKHLLGEITKIRVKQLQTELCLNKNPLEYWYWDENIKFKNNLIGATMSIINKIKYKINSVNDEFYTIIRGKIPIYNLYENKNEYIKDSKVYKKYNIYFLDQLISINDTHLLMWPDLKYRKLYKKISRISKIYNIVKEKTCKERSNEL